MRNRDKEFQPDRSRDPLDQLLHEARWAEPESLRLARLERQWNRLRAQQRQRQRRMRLAAVAAGLLLACALGLWWLPNENPGEQIAPREQPPMREEPESEPQVVSPQQIATHPQQDDAGPHNGEQGRPPTAQEILALRAAERRREVAARERKGDPLEQSIQRLIEEPESQVSEIATPLKPGRIVYEQRLLQTIPSARSERLLAGARLLAELGSARSIPLLVQLSHDREIRPIAVRGLARLADSATLARLAQRETDPKRQQEWLLLLLERNDPPALQCFLAVARSPLCDQAALSALESARNPPIEFLLGTLKAPESGPRLTAARLLGRMKQPRITSELIELARHDVTRQAAFAALILREDAQACRFVLQAWQYPLLRNAIQLAQLESQIALSQISFPTAPEVY